MFVQLVKLVLVKNYENVLGGAMNETEMYTPVLALKKVDLKGRAHQDKSAAARFLYS
jgi:hypothetical protein